MPLFNKSSPFAEFLNNPQDALKVSNRFHNIIMRSFATDAARKAQANGSRAEIRATEAEVTRRFNFLVGWFRTLRGDMGMSLQRTLDELPQALRAELDEGTYVPSPRTMWASAPNTNGGNP